jgi:branched-chain amino acid transport system substrate-binding protein
MAALYADDEMSAAERDWFERFTNAFGREPEYSALEGYRNADVLVTAMQDAGPELTTDSLIQALESLQSYRDIFGYELTFGPDDHKGVDESVLSAVRDGRWIVLEESVRY